MYLWARAVAKYKAALSWITPLFLFLTIFIPLVSLASQSPFHLVCFLSPRCLSCSLYIHMFSVHCPRATPFLLFAFFSLFVLHSRTHSSTLICSLHFYPGGEVLLFPGRLGGLLGGWRKEEGKDGRSSYGRTSVERNNS